MAATTYVINRIDPAARTEPLDLTVSIDAGAASGSATGHETELEHGRPTGNASATGPDLAPLFDLLSAWGPGAANASFDVQFEATVLRKCKVVHYATGHVLVFNFESQEGLP